MDWQNKKLIENAIINSITKSDVLRILNLKLNTGNYNTLDKYIKIYGFDTSHFNRRINDRIFNYKPKSLAEILVENSTYSRSSLKRKLLKYGLKTNVCELCGQTDIWQGKKMCMILDHINGINDDNRIENLRIICPNCNGTLDTNCGKNIKTKYSSNKVKIKKQHEPKPKYDICGCGNKKHRKNKCCKECTKKNNRKTDRPPYEQLLLEVNELGYCGTGRKYGVSDNAIRKWVKFYETH